LVAQSFADHSVFFYAAETFANYVLRLQFRLPGPTDSFGKDCGSPAAPPLPPRQIPGAPRDEERTPMDIRFVRRTLLEVAGDESPDKPHEAIQALAMALLHVAEGVEELRATLADLVVATGSEKPAKPAAHRKSGRVKRKKR